jgi:hypothetical protein
MDTWDEELEWRCRFPDQPVAKKARPHHCQCDVEFGTCPGPINCPYSGEGEENEH